MSVRQWVLLAVVLAAGLLLRFAGIWRTQPIDYHCDDWVIAKPVLQIAETGSLEVMPHYKWSGCGLIYPLGYALYGLKGVFGPYDYDTVLVVGRVMSGIASTLAILVSFLLLRKLSGSVIALMGAGLIAVAKLPVLQGHYGTVTATVSLIMMVVLWLVYDVFDLDGDKSVKWKLGRCAVLGAVIGWGIAAKWTILLAGIPLVVALGLSAVRGRCGRSWGEFFKINAVRCAVIAAVTVVVFCVSMPDVFSHTDKVIEGFKFEMVHNQSGHLGEFTRENSTPGARVVRTVRMLNRAGGIYLLIALGVGLLWCVLKPRRERLFLAGTAVLWLAVLWHNIVSSERHHLVPFMLLCLMLAMALGTGIAAAKNRMRRGVLMGIYAVVMGLALLYTLVCISPFWKPEARLQCARWLQEHMGPRDGVAATPMTPAWCIPGALVGREALTGVRNQALAGGTQYLMAAYRSLAVFKKHPPGERINPNEWFYGHPPDQRTLALYGELNSGDSPYFTVVKDFFARPEFMGVDLRMFFQKPDQETTYGNRGVVLFKVNTQR